MTRLAHLVLALVVLPLAAGCSDDSEYQPPPGGGPVIIDKDEQRRKREAKEKKEAGERLQEGDGYWYVRPKGWRNRTRGFQDVIPFLNDAINERVDNEYLAELMYVTVLPSGPYVYGDFEENEPELARHLRQIATDVRIEKMTTIEGKEAIHLSGVARTGAFEARIDQYVVISGTKIYAITFKLDVDESKASRERLISSILDSWHWDS